MIKALIMTVATLSVAFHLFGIFATYLQSQCLTITFNGLSALTTIVALIGAILVHAIFWAVTVFQIAITATAVAFLIDLRKYRLSTDSERQALLSGSSAGAGAGNGALPTYS